MKSSSRFRIGDKVIFHTDGTKGVASHRAKLLGQEFTIVGEYKDPNKYLVVEVPEYYFDEYELELVEIINTPLWEALK